MSCCGVVTDIALHWNWGEDKYLRCAFSLPQRPPQPSSLSSFSLLMFELSCVRWNGALDLVGLRLTGPFPSTPPLFEQSPEGFALPYACSLMARPQQVWVQIQGKGRTWQLSWAKTQPRSPLMHSQLPKANTRSALPEECEKWRMLPGPKIIN